jgi:spore coat-associated protein N
MTWHRLLLGGVVLLGALTGLVDGGTVASFQSTGSSAPNAFAAGTVDVANSPASALMSLTNMMPGETITAPLTVTNSGSLQLRYALASTVTNSDGKGIGAQLTLTAKSGVASCTNSGFSASGTVLYGAAPLGELGSSLSLIGTPNAFPNGGRTLSPAAGETLCLQVTLPAATGPGFQGATTTATFTFSAQQV